MPPRPALPPNTRGDVRDVLRTALPLMLAASGHAVRLFFDRVMLAKYSSTAIQASLPAGLFSFMCLSLFMGTAHYCATFVAQYTGAERPDRLGPSVWQGIWVALIGGLLLAVMADLGPAFFALAGHAPDVQLAQVAYFRVLMVFSVFPLITAALESFWTGRGQSWVVAACEGGMAALNIFLNYLLIYGHWGLPELGIRGAALGTVIAAGVGPIVYLVLFLRRHNRDRYSAWPQHLFEAGLFRRVLRFGLPNGAQILLDVASFNMFVLLLGRYGDTAREAASIAFSMNAIAFIPMIGIGMATGILVGQAVGRRDTGHAKRAVRSARRIVYAYLAIMACSFVLWPDLYLQLFTRPADPGQAEALVMARRVMRYIAVFLVFDGTFILYASAIKGAGDTRFAMWVGTGIAWGLLVTPTTLAYYAGADVWDLWRILVGYVMIAGLVFYLRYRGGAWRHMRVIEPVENLAPDGALPGAEALAEP